MGGKGHRPREKDEFGFKQVGFQVTTFIQMTYGCQAGGKVSLKLRDVRGRQIWDSSKKQPTKQMKLLRSGDHREDLHENN